MSRERPAYRDNMEMLLEANERKNMIRISKAARVLGITRGNLAAALEADGVATVKVGESLMVSVPTLARWLS
jgi:hypothetical protein